MLRSWTAETRNDGDAAFISLKVKAALPSFFFEGCIYLVEGRIISIAINMEIVVTPRLMGYAVMMVLKLGESGKMKNIQKILIPQIPIIEMAAGTKDLPKPLR